VTWKLHVRRNVFDQERPSESVTLTREFSLPFPPFAGLEIGFRGSNGEQDWCKLKRVQFCTDAGEFWAESTYEICAPEAETAEDAAREMVEVFGWRHDSANHAPR